MISFFTQYGHKCDLENLQVGQIMISDIANALANSGRYNGQTREFYSVAQHCVLLTRYARKQGWNTTVQKELLLHDASEAFVGDVVYHLKARLPFFKELEDKVLAKIFFKFGLDYSKIHPIVGKLDRNICFDEMNQLHSNVDPELKCTPLGIKIRPWTPKKARRQFLKEFRRLYPPRAVWGGPK